ncbi:dTMP kinase [Paenibacillus sp. TH7-28]
MSGKIISISGLDGAGKSTQLTLLQEKLEQAGMKCARLQFESEDYGERAKQKVEELKRFGVVFTRLCLDWKHRFPLMHDFVYTETLQNAGNALAVTSVFAGGCLQVYHECLKPLVEAGVHLVVDRYWYDDIVYRSFWVDEAVVRMLYRSIPAPDLAIFLNTPPGVSYERNRQRIDGQSPLMGNLQNVRAVAEKFQELAHKENMRVIDGALELEEKHALIYHEVASLMQVKPII